VFAIRASFTLRRVYYTSVHAVAVPIALKALLLASMDLGQLTRAPRLDAMVNLARERVVESGIPSKWL
jgi:hypothetical protein